MESDELGDSQQEEEDNRRKDIDHANNIQYKKAAFLSRSSATGDYGELASNPTPLLSELSPYPESVQPKSAQQEEDSEGVIKDRD